MSSTEALSPVPSMCLGSKVFADSVKNVTATSFLGGENSLNKSGKEIEEEI